MFESSGNGRSMAGQLGRRAVRWSARGGLLVLMFIASPGFAGRRLVTANLHPTAHANNPCSFEPEECPEDISPPLENLAAFDRLGGGAFHVRFDCQVVKARCEYAHNGRTKILSSDVKDTRPEDVQRWIQFEEILTRDHEVGQIHFEHFDRCLSRWAGAGNAILNPLGSVDDFPTAAECENLQPPIFIGPRAMLEWMRDDSGASATETRLPEWDSPDPVGIPAEVAVEGV